MDASGPSVAAVGALGLGSAEDAEAFQAFLGETVLQQGVSEPVVAAEPVGASLYDALLSDDDEDELGGLGAGLLAGFDGSHGGGHAALGMGMGLGMGFLGEGGVAEAHAALHGLHGDPLLAGEGLMVELTEEERAILQQWEEQFQADTTAAAGGPTAAGGVTARRGRRGGDADVGGEAGAGAAGAVQLQGRPRLGSRRGPRAKLGDEGEAGSGSDGEGEGGGSGSVLPTSRAGGAGAGKAEKAGAGAGHSAGRKAAGATAAAAAAAAAGARAARGGRRANVREEQLEAEVAHQVWEVWV